MSQKRIRGTNADRFLIVVAPICAGALRDESDHVERFASGPSTASAASIY